MTNGSTLDRQYPVTEWVPKLVGTIDGTMRLWSVELSLGVITERWSTRPEILQKQLDDFYNRNREGVKHMDLHALKEKLLGIVSEVEAEIAKLEGATPADTTSTEGQGAEEAQGEQEAAAGASDAEAQAQDQAQAEEAAAEGQAQEQQAAEGAAAEAQAEGEAEQPAA